MLNVWHGDCTATKLWDDKPLLANNAPVKDHWSYKEGPCYETS